MADGSDTCGAATAAGTPCQHPTTDDGDPDRCWVDSHNEASTGKDAGGRDFAIDEADHDRLLKAAREGFSKAGCARAVGVDEASLRRYLDAHKEFRRAFRRARHDGERTLLRGPLITDDHNKGPDGVEIDGQHARFLLSTSFDYEKTEKRELSTAEDEDSFMFSVNWIDGDE